MEDLKRFLENNLGNFESFNKMQSLMLYVKRKTSPARGGDVLKVLFDLDSQGYFLRSIDNINQI